MKANQAFNEADEAVSPVIGVILMVAITVVLAAVVFVLVTKLSGDQSNSTPKFSVQKSEGTDRITVISADSGADWNNLRLVGSATGVEFELEVTTDGVGGTPITTSGVEVTAAANTMLAGDFIEFCDTIPVNSPAITSWTVTIIDSTNNEKIGDYLFNEVAVCAP